MDLTDDELEDAQSSWERHPFTQRSRAFFNAEADSALKDLLGKCDKSPDPAVAAAYQRWQALTAAAAYFKQRRRDA